VLSDVIAHALVCAGASPKYSATCAFAFGETIQFIHLYMQFGCAAWDEIIQVSDQPVAPSFGSTVCTVVFLSLLMTFAITCQVVPTTDVPDSNACTSLV
jgi:hypothetical protein